MRRIPLKMIEDGSKFRMLGKLAVFTKINNLGMISVQGHREDGKAYVEDRPACSCRTSTGKIFSEEWFIIVEEI